MCRRLMTALCYLSIAVVLVCILLFVSWVFLKFADIPVTTVVVAYDASQMSSNQANLSQTGVVLASM